MSAKSQQCPRPAEPVTGSQTKESSFRHTIQTIAKLWRPRNASENVDTATMSRYAMRLVDMVTGNAYSSDELQDKLQDEIKVWPRSIVLTGDFRAAYVVSPYVKLLDMAKSPLLFPYGITITSWSLDCVNSADPTTEINANLSYCTAPTNAETFATAAEAAPVLVDVLDTTMGNSSGTLASPMDLATGIIPAGKILFLDLDADATDVNILWTLTINFTPNLS